MIDPNAHNRHWLSSPQQLSKKKKNNTAAVVVNNKKKKKKQELFNAEVMDTFCFHWPDMHSYVLVRVLEKTIAILPVRSRLAFLYFHHAPLPTHPSPRELRKALQQQPTKSIQGMFRSWRHTLAIDERGNDLEEEDDDDDDDDDDEEYLTTQITIPAPETPPSTPKVQSNVTLSDVLSYEPNLKTGWIHAPCTVKYDANMFDNHIILTTKHHTVLKLTSRCFSEKMMFINLVKLKHHILVHGIDDDDDKTQVELEDDKEEDSDDDNEEEEEKGGGNNTDKNGKITSKDVIIQLQKKTAWQLENIKQLAFQLEVSKEAITHYTKQLLELEQSFNLLSENTNHIQLNSLKTVLDYVNHQLAQNITSFHSYRKRLFQLQERVSVHIAFLTGARQRFEQIKSRVRNHAWYPWFYTSIAGMVLVFSVLLGYYFLCKK